MLCFDIVPQYDARNLEKGKTMYDNVVSLVKTGKLPNFSDEIPEDSIVLVGHTVNLYEGATGSCLSFNIQWVVVLATPA